MSKVAVRRSVQRPSLLTGLVSYLALNEDSGVRYDAVGANDMTPSGETLTIGTGKLAGAADFTRATPDFLSCAAPSGMPSGTSSWTLTYWLNVRSATAENRYQNIIKYLSGWWNGNYQGFYTLARWPSSGGTLPNAVFIYNGALGAPYHVVAHGPDHIIGQWSFVDVVYDGDAGQARVRRNLVDLDGWVPWASGVGTVAGGTPLTFSVDDTERGIDGLLDDVSLWSRALSDDELSQLYNTGSGLAYPFGD